MRSFPTEVTNAGGVG